MTLLTRTLALGATGAVTLALLAACGSGSGDAGSDGSAPEVTITAPADGASVGATFEVTWDTNVELGDPETGRDHVHVFVDGHSNDYTVVGGNEFTVKNLAPGRHTVDVTLQHADHSSAGAEDEVEVDVGTSGAPTDTSSPDDGDSAGYGGGGY
jgi:hypothetical protein